MSRSSSERQRHALGQTAPHRVADRQIHARVQMIDAVLELEIGGADLEAPLESIGVQRPRPAAAPRQRRTAREASMRRPTAGGRSLSLSAGVHCLVKAA